MYTKQTRALSITFALPTGGDVSKWRKEDYEASAAKRKADQEAEEEAARALALKWREKKNAVNELQVIETVAELDNALEAAGPAEAPRSKSSPPSTMCACSATRRVTSNRGRRYLLAP